MTCALASVHFRASTPAAERCMKLNIRNSKGKRSKRTGFRYRMKTKGGRKVLQRHRQRGRHLTPKG